MPATHLTAIEINGTYYGSQKPESSPRWHDETPADFVFALKGPRFATNRRVLAEAGGSIEKFLASGITRLKQNWGRSTGNSWRPRNSTPAISKPS